jgi:hypothetical protein
MPSNINRLAVLALAKGLHVVVKPRNLRRSLLFKETPLRLRPRTFIVSNRPLVDIVKPCRGSQASLVANLRAHEYADFVSFLLLQINFLSRELSSPPSQYLSDQCSKSVSPSLSWARQARRRPRSTVQKPFQRRGEVLAGAYQYWRALVLASSALRASVWGSRIEAPYKK